jgi:membrane associated rhomboid family serine protease
VLPLKDNVITGRVPVVTLLLIALNFLAFAWQLSKPDDRATTPELAQAGVSERDQVSIEYGAIPYRLIHGGECGVTRRDIVCGSDGIVAAGEGSSTVPDNLDEPSWFATIFTSMFLHADLLHIAGNMLFLWIFGNAVEASMGRGRYLLFYLLAGAVAAYSQALLDTFATGPQIGASGAVAGVLGAYAILHPRAKVLSIVLIIFFVTLIEVPAMLLLAAWFVLQFVPAVGQLATPDVAGGGIAYLAHVGGFVFGLAAVHLFARNRSFAQLRPSEP